MTALSSPGSQGLARRLVLRLLQVLTIVSVVIGIRWIVTGHVNVIALQLFFTGVGVGLFGACGLVSDDLGRRRPSVWSRLGVISALIGGSLVIVTVWGVFVLPVVWRALGACFFIAFAGVRGSLIHAVGHRSIGVRQLALLGVTLTMALGVMLSVRGLSPLGFKLFGIAALVETGAVLSMLIRRASHASNNNVDSNTDSNVDSNTDNDLDTTDKSNQTR